MNKFENLYMFFNALAIYSSYNDVCVDDYKYIDNKNVQDLLFDIYIGVMQLDCMDPEPDDFEERIDLFIENIRLRLEKLLPDEQDYVKRNLIKTFNLQEEEEIKLKKERKDKYE